MANHEKRKYVKPSEKPRLRTAFLRLREWLRNQTEKQFLREKTRKLVV